MKGRRFFTHAEIERIQAILVELPRTTATRNKLRDLGFYISDFSTSRFSLDDFKRLIAMGEIKVEDRPTEKVVVVKAAYRDTPASGTSCAEEERLRYRPKRIKYLFVGESVPASGKFFYFADSILFFQTHRAFVEVFGRACGDGAAFLRFFQKKGCFVDDLCAMPVNQLKSDDPVRLKERTDGVKPLADRMKSYQPEEVIVVMKAIAPDISQACAVAGIDLPSLALPFPARPSHQNTYVAKLAAFLRTIK